ncbi:uncharacterized protein SPPG_03103 [Spizellomyces punctatus DAOM BR117]|uniref:Uncharacterized protein n=1 Tax=Spizellomyces punctatus (strain DAOM BR117) TaxID=645134 RepID=A0A0L0HJS8_SPIPD|nr:uncharacterized protein SPPG_03103 [Spizellomyces punctatus DAOM BR117]KND01293.1 hypothetical protein SPPG_03103 [Spizellomyces punctatus DAOM BR117]|eukprot:XP_016609332.1 hypothetical protein SPPG_03103 [Spizellomyces punctatus DAOM BR117]
MGYFENLLGFGDAQQRNQEVYNTERVEHHHKSSWSHEIIAGAAGYEAMKSYERHCAANGQPQSHSQMKEILAGLAAAEVDKLFETKGLDWLDRDRAKQQAIAQAHRETSPRRVLFKADMAVKVDMVAVKVDMVAVKVDMVAVKADMAEVKADMVAVKVDMVAVKADMVAVKVDMVAVKADMAEVKADMAEVKADMAEVKADMAEVKVNMAVKADMAVDIDR